MKRIAKTDQVYGTDQRRVRAGEAFDVDPKDVHILLMLDRIEPETASIQDTYRTRAMKARRVV